MTDKNAKQPAGWVFYDGECAFCLRWVQRMERALVSRGYTLETLQARNRALTEMILQLPDGRELGGADAAVFLAKHIWWLWPLWLTGKVPGAMIPLRAGYRFIAKNRYCTNKTCKLNKQGKP